MSDLLPDRLCVNTMMVAEVAGSDTNGELLGALRGETGSPVVMNSEAGGSVPVGLIPFGSHVHTQDKSAVVGDTTAPISPKNLTEDWPAPKNIHSFYFVRYRPYDDPKIRSKIAEADKEIRKMNQSRIQSIEELQLKKLERTDLINQLRTLKDENNKCRMILDDKRKEMEPLHDALGKLRNTGSNIRGSLCSSEEELNDVIYSLQYRMQHESISLAEEKQILREIKQLEGTREKVIEKAAMRAKIHESLGQKEDIRDQVKLLGVDFDGKKKEQQLVWKKITQTEDKLKTLTAEIKSLQSDLTDAAKNKDKILKSIKELRIQHDDGNEKFYQYRLLQNKVKELAANKNVEDLEKLSRSEVDGFMSLWNADKSFRDDYVRRLLPSLDARQLSHDGRMRNPGEAPLMPREPPRPLASAPSSNNTKRNVESQKEVDPPVEKPGTRKGATPALKPDSSKDHSWDETHKDDDPVTVTHSMEEAKEEIPPLEVAQESSVTEEIVDEEMLKEKRREEEIEKARQAMERKKKKAAKAAAKAAKMEEMKAEKKRKEQEKKLKKKAVMAGAVSATAAEKPGDGASEGGEEEHKKLETVVEAVGPPNERVKKDHNNARLRGYPRTRTSLPKVISRKKKSNTYWLWAVPALLISALLPLLLYHLKQRHTVENHQG